MILKTVREFIIDFLNFYFLNTDFSLTILSIHMKRLAIFYNVPLKGRVSNNFDLGPSFSFMV